MVQLERNRPLQQIERSDLKGRVVENSILLSIPEEEFALLRPHLEFIPLTTYEVLQEPGQPVEFAVFLNSGLVSLLVVTSDAKSVEVGMVGKDGFTGAYLGAGVRDSSQRAIIQIPAEAFRVKSKSLETVLPHTPKLQQELNRYLLLQGMQVAQLAACNRLHEIDQRLARWLLMSHDRVGGDSLPVTHDVLAQMLGSGRPTVTIAAGGLQRAGIIEYTRGMIRILSRKALETAACECYQVIRRITQNNGTK